MIEPANQAIERAMLNDPDIAFYTVNLWKAQCKAYEKRISALEEDKERLVNVYDAALALRLFEQGPPRNTSFFNVPEIKQIAILQSELDTALAAVKEQNNG